MPSSRRRNALPPTHTWPPRDRRTTAAGGVGDAASTARSAFRTAAGELASTPSAASTATTESAATSTGRRSWSLYVTATPCASASRLRSASSLAGREVTARVLPAGGPAMRPRLRCLDLRGQAEQCHLVAGPPDELDTDRQIVVRPVQRDVDRRLTAHVVGRRERRVALLVLEVLCGIVVVAQPADLRGGLRQRRGENGVEMRGPLELLTSGGAQCGQGGPDVEGRQGAPALAQPSGQRPQPVLVLWRHRQRRELDRPQALEHGDQLGAERRRMVLDGVTERREQLGRMLIGGDALGMDLRARDGGRDVAADAQRRRLLVAGREERSRVWAALPDPVLAGRPGHRVEQRRSVADGAGERTVHRQAADLGVERSGGDATAAGLDAEQPVDARRDADRAAAAAARRCRKEPGPDGDRGAAARDA